VPFYEICSETAVINIVLKGKIPSQTQISYPASAIDVIDDRMWSLLKLCWSFKPDDRPTCRRITNFLEIKECIEHRSGLAYDQIVGFRIAMREKVDFSFNLKNVLYLFDEVSSVHNVVVLRTDGIYARLTARGDNRWYTAEIRGREEWLPDQSNYFLLSSLYCVTALVLFHGKPHISIGLI